MGEIKLASKPRSCLSVIVAVNWSIGRDRIEETNGMGLFKTLQIPASSDHNDNTNPESVDETLCGTPRSTSAAYTHIQFQHSVNCALEK